MRKRLKVAVLFDMRYAPPEGLDFEQEIRAQNWQTELNVIEALKHLGHEVTVLGVYDDPGAILNHVKAHEPDVVFNLAEEFNERSAYDRNVVALLQMADVRYTGTGPTGLTLCKNKGMVKEILAYHHIDFPDFVIFPPGAVIRKPRGLAYPLFIKPLKDEASYGISQESFVDGDEALESRVRFIHERMDQGALVEEYVEGRELYASVIGNRRLEVLPLREVIFSKVPEERPRIATFKAKWDEAYRQRWGIQNTFAKDLPEGVEKRIIRVCKSVYRVLHMRGYGRIDLRLTTENRIVVLEANPNPSLTTDDEFVQSALKTGMTYGKLIQRILRLALSP